MTCRTRATNPGATVVRNVQNRGWTDADRDFVVDCDLLSAAANGECAAASSTAANFGKLGTQTRVDPGVLKGWGVRPGDTQYTASIQQQLLPRVSAEFSYTHRSFHGFFLTTDLSKHAGEVLSGNPAVSYETYTLTAPQDARLPGGWVPGHGLRDDRGGQCAGGHSVPVPRVRPGRRTRERVDGFEVTVNARLRGGLTAQVGSQTGRGKVNTCAIAAKYAPTVAVNTGSQGPDPRGCNNVEPWFSTVRGLASYTIPKVDVLVSATIRSQPPVAITATWQVPNTVIQQAYGKLPPGALVAGQHEHRADRQRAPAVGDTRRTQVDMRFAKILRFGGTRTDIGVDLNNLLNTSYATAFNATYIYNTDNTPRPSGWVRRPASTTLGSCA